MGRRPRNDSAQSITNESQNSVTKPELVIENLKRKQPVAASDHVTVRDLAHELDVDPERIRALVDRQYIRIIKAEPYLEDCIVARPRTTGMKWLKRTFAPLRMVPVLPIGYVRQLLEVENCAEVRHLCLNYDITIHDDVVFGELLTIADFWKMWRWIFLSRFSRFDRQAMLWMIFNQRGPKNKRMRSLNYYDALENEIRRVSKMEEPDRTFRAVALYEAFRDARMFSQVGQLYEKKVIAPKIDPEKIEKLFRSLLRKSLGTMAYAEDAEPYAAQPPASSESSHRASSNEP